jgi:hypothetical protein
LAKTRGYSEVIGQGQRLFRGTAGTGLLNVPAAHAYLSTYTAKDELLAINVSIPARNNAAGLYLRNACEVLLSIHQGPNLAPMSHRCYLRVVAIEWELTIYLLLGSVQGGTISQVVTSGSA